MIKRILIKFAKFTTAAIISLTTYSDIISGRMNFRYGHFITAADNPRQFWITVAFKIAFSIAMFVFAFAKDVEANCD